MTSPGWSIVTSGVGSTTTAGTTSRLSTRPCDTSTVFWLDGRIGSSSPCDGIGGKQRTGSPALRGDNPRCSPTGRCCRGAAEQWEPYDAGVSRTVLRARGGVTPLRDSPRDRLSAGRGWEEAPRGAERPAITVRSVSPRRQDPADRVRTVRRRVSVGCRSPASGDLQFSGLYALLREDQKRQVHGQAQNASQTHGTEAQGGPGGDAAADARSSSRAASLAVPGAPWSLSLLWCHLQLSGASRVADLRGQALAPDARQAQPKRPPYLEVLQEAPDRLPDSRTGYPSALVQMIAPPPVFPEEPAAVTPHGGFCRGQKPAMAALPAKSACCVATWRGLETWYGRDALTNWRASPRPYLRARGGATPLRDSPGGYLRVRGGGAGGARGGKSCLEG